MPRPIVGEPPAWSSGLAKGPRYPASPSYYYPQIRWAGQLHGAEPEYVHDSLRNLLARYPGCNSSHLKRLHAIGAAWDAAEVEQWTTQRRH